MRTTAIFNLKGGVGKTLTTAAMADILAIDYKKRVLVIDADAQGNLTQYFGVDAEAGATTLDLLQGNHETVYRDWVSPARPDVSIDIVPADMSLIYADVDAIQDGRCNLHAMDDLRAAIDEDAASPDPECRAEAYDYLLIDCPPAFSAASSAALAAADDVVIPIRLDAFSTAGMAELMAQITNMRRINDRLRIAGILGTQYQRTPEEVSALEYLRNESGLPVFEHMIRQSPRVSGATFARVPLIQYSPQSGAAMDYRRFVAEYIAQEGGAGHGKA